MELCGAVPRGARTGGGRDRRATTGHAGGLVGAAAVGATRGRTDSGPRLRTQAHQPFEGPGILRHIVRLSCYGTITSVAKKLLARHAGFVARLAIRNASSAYIALYDAAVSKFTGCVRQFVIEGGVEHLGHYHALVTLRSHVNHGRSPLLLGVRDDQAICSDEGNAVHLRRREEHEIGRIVVGRTGEAGALHQHRPRQRKKKKFLVPALLVATILRNRRTA